jgi:FlgD Ig-like domain
MSRLPLFAFSVLVAATVAAFFITQHLKVATPLIAGFPRPYPPAINPVSGGACDVTGQLMSHRRMSISFYLLHHSDSVDVRVVDARGNPVATLARDRFMPGGDHPKRVQFTWDGREPNGSFAPDGRYYVTVHLVHQQRTVTISDNNGPVPLIVKTKPPKPVVTSVLPSAVSAAYATPVKIDYTGNENRGATVLIYRLAPRQAPQLVASFITPWKAQSTIWDGKLARRPARAGVYLIRLKVTDAACNTGTSSPPAAKAAANEVVVRG